ncbi:MAG TPA: hypothetical protein VK723_00860, partial [Thermoplasmata archaeon]|nr:hypothetical protein [Thermoplasmata archaeon]
GITMPGVPKRIVGGEKVRDLRNRLVRRVRRTHVVVALLGKGGSGLSARRELAKTLRRLRIIALVPEDDFPPDIGASLAEEAVLSDVDTHLVFVHVESWGSALEFGQLRALPRVAPKLRVLVSPAYHPLYGARTSYLTDAYMTHLALHGHVYAVGEPGRLRIPKAEELVVLLSERFRQAKALGIK